VQDFLVQEGDEENGEIANFANPKWKRVLMQETSLFW